jgi:hypothetical protein
MLSIWREVVPCAFRILEKILHRNKARYLLLGDASKDENG